MSTVAENRAVFDKIYRQHRWVLGSGLGSLPCFNRPGIAFLNRFLDEHPDIRTVVDIGCGDMQVASRLHLQGMAYHGCDVSEVIIQRAKKRWQEQGKLFFQVDAVNEEIPSGDLALVRDVLLHLPNGDIQRLLGKLDRFPYVLIQTNITDRPIANRDIPAGSFRLLDMTQPPFSFGAYRLAFTYTETTFKLLNPLLRLLGLLPHYKGVYLKAPGSAGRRAARSLPRTAPLPIQEGGARVAIQMRKSDAPPAEGTELVEVQD